MKESLIENQSLKEVFDELTAGMSLLKESEQATNVFKDFFFKGATIVFFKLEAFEKIVEGEEKKKALEDEIKTHIIENLLRGMSKESLSKFGVST